MSTVTVWDVPTRVFHWLFTACILAAYFTGEAEAGAAYQLHVAAGYGAGLLVIFRVAWGFVGTRYARFSQFTPGPAAIGRHLSALTRLSPPRMLGHNPLGAIAIFAMLALAAGAVWTGVGLTEQGEELHEFFANALIAVVVLHVAAVIFDSVMTGENLTRAMITGRKEAAGTVEAEAITGTSEDRDARLGISRRGFGARVALGLAITAIVAVGFAAESRFLAWPPPTHEEAELEEEGEEHEERAEVE